MTDVIHIDMKSKYVEENKSVVHELAVQQQLTHFTGGYSLVLFLVVRVQSRVRSLINNLNEKT